MLFQDPLSTRIHTQDLAGHLEESKQKIFHQLCELATFGPAVTEFKLYLFEVVCAFVRVHACASAVSEPVVVWDGDSPELVCLV